MYPQCILGSLKEQKVHRGLMASATVPPQCIRTAERRGHFPVICASLDLSTDLLWSSTEGLVHRPTMVPTYGAAVVLPVEVQYTEKMATWGEGTLTSSLKPLGQFEVCGFVNKCRDSENASCPSLYQKVQFSLGMVQGSLSACGVKTAI